jgi:hypothetical protein
MPDLFKSFRIDFLSFAIGFVTALLFWWAVSQLRAAWPQIQKRIKAFIEENRSRGSSDIEERLRKETIRRAQGQHLAASLFSLEEILIPPTLLAPPIAISPGSSDTPDVEPLLVIPYLPDWPDLPCQLSVNRISLAEVLQACPKIAVIGQPGSGKSVALSHLAIQIARRGTGFAALADLVPLSVHVSDLEFNQESKSEPLGQFIELARAYLPAIMSGQVPGMVRLAAQTGRLLLILDGADELSQSKLKDLGQFLNNLLAQNPKIRLVMSASDEFLDGLYFLRIIPLAIASWNSAQRKQFTERWGQCWNEHIVPINQNPNLDPILLNTWLAPETTILTPFEMTLKVWAAYAGDTFGSSNTDSLDSYLRRAIPDANLISPLTQLAVQIVHSGDATISFGSVTPQNGAIESDAIFENGILVRRQHDRLSFVHPILLGYLSSQIINEIGHIDKIISQPAWAGRNLVLHYLASHQDISDIVNSLLEKATDDPILRNLFMVARWLKDSQPDAGWRNQVMRQLMGLMQNEGASFSLRTRALAALIGSNDPSVVLLLRDQMISSSAPVRHLAILGAGAAQDTKSWRDLVGLLGDTDRTVRQAVCYALLAFNTPQTIQVSAEIMRQGDEELSRLIAEGLAMRPEIGYPLLKEVCTNENLLVRRAAIFGLERIADPWASATLQKMAMEDGQWIVRNAAVQALEDRQKIKPYVPKPLPAPHESAWLIAFASKQGRGISPRQPVIDLLLLALKNGTAEEQIACLDYLRMEPKPDPGLIGALYKTMFANENRLGDEIFCTLWLYSTCGTALPPTREFGLG